MDIVIGLAAMQDAGFMHRDVKLENVLVRVDAQHCVTEVVLADFGTATSSNSPKTVVGSPGYMAPEVLQGKYDFNADVFSFGVLLSELIPKPELVRAVRAPDSPVPRAVVLPANTPDGWRALVRDCTQLLPSSRPTAQQVVARLRTLLEQENAPARQCLICMDAPRERRLLPCNHAVACANHAAILQARGDRCPLCRIPIEGIAPLGGSVATNPPRQPEVHT